MFMNIAALLLFLGLTWIWMNRGFLSALLHMVCTIAAGAVAFAFWEPLAHLLIGMAPESGFMTVTAFIAWGAALLAPFGVALLLFRYIADTVVKSNVKPLPIADYVGGGICGAVSGAITVGILVIGMGFMPLGTGFMGYRPVNYTESGQASGSLERAGGLWIPVEKLTAGLYGRLSETTLRTGEPLAEWYPELDVAGYAINMSAVEGKARPSMDSDDMRVTGTYSVGDPAGTSSIRDLLLEDVTPDPDSGELAYQGYVDLHGEPVQNGSLFGVMMEFEKGAKENTGQLVFGNGQVQLLMTAQNGERLAAHPVAIISKQNSSSTEAYGRGPFFVEDLHYASVGAGTVVKMGFEFVVPAGARVDALSVRNTRVMLDAEPGTVYPDERSRFGALTSGQLVAGSSTATFDTSSAATEEGISRAGRGAETQAVVAGHMLGVTFERRQGAGFDYDEDNRILRGKTTLRTSEVGSRVAEANVRVDRLASPSDIVIVKVNVSRDSAASLLGQAARSAERVVPPQLVSTNGEIYQACGFIYQDSELYIIEYDPAVTIRGIASLPQRTRLSPSRQDQKLQLLFRCSKGVELDYFALGNKVIVDLEPPLLLDMKQD